MMQPVELRIATNDDIDAFIGEAIQHFFSGSEEEARDNLGPYDDNDTSFIIACIDDEPIAVVTVRWRPNYPPFKEAGIPFIQNIEVKWELRGKGFGSRVMEAWSSTSQSALTRPASVWRCSMTTGRRSGCMPDAATSRTAAARVIASRHCSAGKPSPSTTIT